MFAFFVLSIIVFVGYYASKIELEENLTKFIPNNENIKKINKLFQNSGLADKLVVNITLSDTSAQPQPEKLIAFANDFVNALQTDYFNTYIDSILSNIPEDAMFEVYDFIYDNLPIYLNPADFEKIENSLSDSVIERTVFSNYKILMSPVSFALKTPLLKDPIGFMKFPMEKLQSLQFDENFNLYDGYILSKDGRNLLAFIIPLNSSAETAKNGLMLNGIDSVITNLASLYKGEVNAEYFGSAAVAAGNANRIKKDIQITVSIAFVILMIFISWYFRRVSIFLIIILPVVLGGGVAVALLYLIKTKISAISLGVGSVLVGITIDYSLHVINHFRNSGSVKSLLKDVTTPLAMSCLTTASAFLCLFLVSSEALHELGLFAALSVVFAALFSLLVLPHFLKPLKNNSHPGLWNSFIDKITSYPMDKNKILIFSVILISIACLFSFRKVEFESDMMKMNYMSEKLIRAEQNLNKISNISLKSFYLVSSGKNLEQALSVNESAAAKAEELKQKKLINEYSPVSSLIVSNDLQKKRISAWNNFWTTEKKQRVKNELTHAGLKYKFKKGAFEQFYHLIDREFIPLNENQFRKVKKTFLSGFIYESEGLCMVVTQIKGSRANKENILSSFAGIPNTFVFDKEYLTHELIKILKSDFNLLVWVSLLVVFLIIVIAYGRIELALIAFLPMMLSWFWTLGVMGAIGIKFNIFNIIISTFIFGLGIDYSIFIMQGLLQEYKYGKKNLPSFKTSILLSVLTTITGLGVLIFAEHPSLRSIAMISIIGISSVVIISFTLVPLMFRWLFYKADRKRTAPVTFFIVIYSIICYTYFYLLAVLLALMGVTLFRLLPENLRKRLLHFLLSYISKSTIYLMFLAKKKIINKNNEDFSKPSLIICNHQSLIDIPLVLMLTPKLIVLTNDWVWESPVMGFLVKQVDFYPAGLGLDNIIEKLREKVKQGYSILVFPEGTRAEDLRIKRFHKGAFYLAEKLNLDILPIIIHGTGHYVAKGEMYGKKSTITIKYLDRIPASNSKFGTSYKERAKTIGRYFREEFEKVNKEYQYPAYYRDKLIKNYIYKGPVLEWYARIKTRMEDNYSFFHNLIPLKAQIIDVGCGYGFLSYMLGFLSDGRKITGIDYDEDKIAVANNCRSRHLCRDQNVNFVCADVTRYNFALSDVFILNDVLHYLPFQEQRQLISNCIINLNKGGMIIIRDADKDLEKRHFYTRLSEFYSTNFGFNKTQNNLEFVSGKEVLKIVKENNMEVQVFDNTTITSNLVYVIKHSNGKV